MIDDVKYFNYFILYSTDKEVSLLARSFFSKFSEASSLWVCSGLCRSHSIFLTGSSLCLPKQCEVATQKHNTKPTSWPNKAP